MWNAGIYQIHTIKEEKCESKISNEDEKSMKIISARDTNKLIECLEVNIDYSNKESKKYGKIKQ